MNTSFDSSDVGLAWSVLHLLMDIRGVCCHEGPNPCLAGVLWYVFSLRRQTDFLALLVLARRAAVPVKISTADNNIPRKYQRVPRNYYQY